VDIDRLAKICGMLGSVHPGERAAAALKATVLLKEAGLTWEAFVHARQERASQNAPDRKPKRWRRPKTFDTEQPHAALARQLLATGFPSFINEKAAQFLRDVAGSLACIELTEGQAAYLADIEKKCASMRRAA